MAEATDISEVKALLGRDYGLDPTRGGMTRALTRHVAARGEALGVDVRGYVERVETDPRERQALVHLMTVNHSWFFRDPKQLEALGERMLDLRSGDSERVLNIWVAGCAMGQEAWTLAMIAAQLGIQVEVLATDVDIEAVVAARRASYGAWSLRELPPPLWRHLEATRDDRWTIRDELRARVNFEVHNLCDPSPPGRFDVISCRNVLIYFEPERAHEAVDRMRASLGPDGELVLGAGDLMFQPRVSEVPERPMPARVAGSPSASIASARRPRVPASRINSAPPRRGERAPAVASPEAPGAAAPPSGAARARTISLVDHEALEQAGAAVARGEIDRALPVLEDLVSLDPLLAEAHLWVGIAHHGVGRNRLAGEALRRARCLEPELWPGTLFAALNHERRGRWGAAARCWAELDRLMHTPDGPPIRGTAALQNALPTWQAEARALAKQRNSERRQGTLGEALDRTDD